MPHPACLRILRRAVALLFLALCTTSSHAVQLGIDRLKALAAAQTNHWENALAGMVASVSKKAANGLVEVDR